MNSKWYSFVGYAGIVAALISAVMAIFGLTDKLGNRDLIVGVSTVIVTATVGIFSLSIARFTKTLTRRPRIFLSYARNDAQQASLLREALRKEGAYVWFDETNLRAGEDLKATLEAAIENSNAVVLMLSHSPGPYVKLELEAAQARHVPILLVLGPNVDRPIGLERAHAVTLKADGSNIGEVAAAAFRAGKHEFGHAGSAV